MLQKVSFSESSDEVLVEAVGDYNSEHGHKANDQPAGEGTNYQWTWEQTEVVMQGVRNGQNPTVIMRTLKTLNSDIP